MEVNGQLHASTAVFLGKSPRCLLDGRLARPQSQSEHRGGEKNLVLPGIEYAPSISVAIPIELSRLFYTEDGGNNFV
jgi:hypothetical protein